MQIPPWYGMSAGTSKITSLLFLFIETYSFISPYPFEKLWFDMKKNTLSFVIIIPPWYGNSAGTSQITSLLFLGKYLSVFEKAKKYLKAYPLWKIQIFHEKKNVIFLMQIPPWYGNSAGTSKITSLLFLFIETYSFISPYPFEKLWFDMKKNTLSFVIIIPPWYGNSAGTSQITSLLFLDKYLSVFEKAQKFPKAYPFAKTQILGVEKKCYFSYANTSLISKQCRDLKNNLPVIFMHRDL